MNFISKVKNLKGKVVILRADFNVPIKNGLIVDTSRIDANIETINFLKEKGAKVFIISHLGKDGNETLKPVFEYLKKIYEITFYEKIPENKKDITGLVLLENVRSFDGEMTNSLEFAKNLSKLADIFVNDAFSVSHRKQSSVYAITHFLPSYFGLHFEKEMTSLSAVFKPERPFTFIIGGAKFDTKLPIIKKFLKIADSVFVGGALANRFLELKGLSIGESFSDRGDYGLEEIINNKKIVLPEDVVVKEKNGTSSLVSVSGVSSNGEIVDIGETTVQAMKDLLEKSKSILWNGPFGKYEEGFDKATIEILNFLKDKKDKKIIIGGGDTVAVISKLGIKNEFYFVSMAGGAMIDYLSGGTLPGIDAVKKSNKRFFIKKLFIR
ncbi:phosphoglycerate kinase [Candidatus Nomurabacteria bacterium]|nr:phosphoglycerate kinase [Candidatus Nomurabacteria bacterium]USN94742.1 MAG: phosphoglycerate kinase [Candidatus Nomurabacteria bacterium]